MDLVYGDHNHLNDGTQLDGGIEGDRRWQQRWKRLAELSPAHYAVPKGRVGRRFVDLVTSEFHGARTRKWNSERPLTFISVVLQRTSGVRRSCDIRRRLSRRMDLWEQKLFAGLVDDTVAECESKLPGARRTDEESEARAFNSTVLSGRLRQAVRRLTSRDGGGVMHPDDLCTKTGLPILQVLRSKHPAARVPDLDVPDCKVFEPYPTVPTAIPMEVTAEHIEKVASRLSGAAGPGGTDAVDLRNWLIRFGANSERLRVEMAAWAEWLANESPPWAAYRATMMCRLVALDKTPGTRPVGIGEIWRRLWSKTIILIVGDQATAACGNYNLCAGLPAGIEGAIHAAAKNWDEAHGDNLETPSAIPAEGWPPPVLEETPLPPDTQEPMAAETEDTDPAADPIIGSLIDAFNGFNELNRKAMLWTVRHRWAAGARFALNCYRHSAILIVRRPGGRCATIDSEEGVTQGDPLAMLLYGVALLPLAESLRKAEPTLLQPWYADDFMMHGRATATARATRILMIEGPPRGYYPEPAKSIVVCVPEDRATAEKILAEFEFKYTDGFRYVGGFMGTAKAQEEWLLPQIDNWVAGIHKLAKVAKRFPQTAYAGMARSLQSEWQYVQRVAPDMGPVFAPVERALCETFLPALLGDELPVSEATRDQASLSTKFAGLGLPDPVQSAAESHMSSAVGTSLLATSLRDGAQLDVAAHCKQVSHGRKSSQQRKATNSEELLESLCDGATAREKRRLERARETGGWLNILPDSLNGTELSSEEFRDSIRIRLGFTPTALPEKCDGCGHCFTVEHALTCKKGGLVLLRHNDLAAEWHELCATALTPSAVSDEPLIHSGRVITQGNNGSGLNAGRRGPSNGNNPDPRELRGDISAHGFWRRGTTAIFDVRIADTDAPSYRGQDPKKVLARHEKEKKDKYLDACIERRRQFTPLVYSVDGLMGSEARAASKRLASHLANKWKRAYSDVCGYVLSRQSLALVRATSLCLRGARDPTARIRSPAWDSGTGLSLYR